MSSQPIALVVSVEIKPDRLEEFMGTAKNLHNSPLIFTILTVPCTLGVIEKDARLSIQNEGGNCLRFDVLKDNESSNKFIFYEVYKDLDAVARHKETPHFKLWADFKAR